MRVVGPEPLARFDLAGGRADQLGADVLSHQGELASPALAVARVFPLVAQDVEDLHSVRSQSELTLGSQPNRCAGPSSARAPAGSAVLPRTPAPLKMDE
jgi:hypothetical protein